MFIEHKIMIIMWYIGAQYLSFNYFGTGHGIPTLTDWKCIGNETNLLDCLHTSGSSCFSYPSGYLRPSIRCMGEIIIGNIYSIIKMFIIL